MKPLISIIVPVFNVENYIEFCVKSLCRQTYSNIEIILINDGSTDSSGLICDQLRKSDNRIAGGPYTMVEGLLYFQQFHLPAEDSPGRIYPVPFRKERVIGSAGRGYSGCP